MKKLNRKGFTLIELLAVIVILAVVMGIAANSVLSSMNKSRGGSLSDTAQVVSQGMITKYTETLVDGVPTSVYGVYDFSTSHRYYITKSVAETFNISDKSYSINDSATAIDDSTTVAHSFFSFDSTNGKIVVCMVANKTGNVFVSGYAKGGSVTFADKTYTVANGDMFACSDGTKSW